ncbi:MAG: Nif3-like dinuclear metal center hexameric protein [Janthinobacterium lividum]
MALSAGSVAATRALLAATPSAGALTAAAVLDRIQQDRADQWKLATDGTLKAGGPATPITGIVTTALASMSVLQAAVQAGANMVITSEPLFFSKQDSPTPPVLPVAGAPLDPVVTAKAAFLQQHRMVVLRLKEPWNVQAPNPFVVGFAQDLRWMRYVDRSDPARLTLPAMPLEAFARVVKARLGNRGGMRVVGDRHLVMRSVGFLPGSTPLQSALEMLPQVDVIVAGEVREWETVEYVRDTVALGGRKALVYVGRVVSEEPGMRQCARWLQTIVPEVRCSFLSAGDPYWRPTA